MKKPGWIDEFKKVIMRGNVIDLAVGVIIGGAFQSIVTSVINDLVMPFIGLLTGDVNFVDQFVVLRVPEGVDKATLTTLEAATAAGATTFNYGKFITALINFLIMAMVIFMLVKLINKITTLGKKKEEEIQEVAPTTKKCPFCCSEIDIEATRCPHCTSLLEENKE